MEKTFFEFDTTKEYFCYDTDMLIAKYKTEFYECDISQGIDCDMILYSDAKIAESSIVNDKNIYETRVAFEELQDVICRRIYAVYKGKPFSVGYLYNRFSDVD